MLVLQGHSGKNHEEQFVLEVLLSGKNMACLASTIYKLGLGYHSVAKPGITESTSEGEQITKCEFCLGDWLKKIMDSIYGIQYQLVHILLEGNPRKRKFVITEESERMVTATIPGKKIVI